MRLFLIKLTIFMGLALAGYLGILLAVVTLNVRAAESCRLGPEIDTVILGDSHTMWSINDASIPRLRNISLNAEGYKYTFRKLELLLEREPGVEHVYLGVGYHNFAGYYDEYITGGAFKFFAHRYVSILGLSDYAQVFARRPTELPQLVKMLITNGARPALRQKCELYGTFPEERQHQTFDPVSMRKRVDSQYFVAGAVAGESSSNVAYLQKIVDLCRAKDLRITLLNTPIHKDYAARVPAKFREMLTGFVRTNGLEYYDFADLDLPDSAFLPDGDHLNYAGALLTTQRFAAYHQAR